MSADTDTLSPVAPPPPVPHDAISAFCQAEHELLRGKRALQAQRQPLQATKRAALEQLQARLRALALPGVNVRLDDETCWRVKATERKVQRGISRKIVTQALSDDTLAALCERREPVTLENLRTWLWDTLKAARTHTSPWLSITKSKTDLDTVLPPEAQLEGGGSREECADQARNELRALLAQHQEAAHSLKTLAATARTQGQPTRERSSAAHPDVLQYMASREVALQPIQLGGEQFNMRRRQSTRIVPPTKRADVEALIARTLSTVLPDAVDPHAELTDDQLEKVQTQLVAELVAQLPRKQEVKVSLLSRRAPAAKKSDDNVNPAAGHAAAGDAVPHPGDAE